jgi:PAS domain S-box-containing protein
MNLNEKIKSLFQSLSSWQVVFYSILCAVLITDLVTSFASLWFWNEIHPGLIVLGTINAILVPLIILPSILGALQKTAKLEEQAQTGSAVQQRADEMSLLYELGISLASGKDLYETLLILQSGVLKFVQADSLFVAIYDENSDTISYPIFFEGGQLAQHPSRILGKNPGLTGPVVYNKKTLYLPNFRSREALNQYTPVDDNDLALHSFLAIPLMVNERVIGVLSVQGNKIDAYSAEQIHLMENIAVQAALAIDKAGLLEQLQSELEERKRIEAGLHERDAILEAIAIAAEEFLKTSDWRTRIDIVLEKLGTTINASHVYLFEHHVDVDKKMAASMRYEWTAPGFISDLDDPYYQNRPIHKEGVDEATDLLQRGEAFIANASLFPTSEKERMIQLGIKALLEMPLLVNGQWWGTIGFDDMVQDRTWSASEVDALKIAAGILSAAIQRQKADADLQKSERIYRQAIEAADAVPYFQSYDEDIYAFMGEGIRAMTGYGPEEMTPQLWSNITEETVLLGEAKGMDVKDAIQQARQGIFKTWKSDQRIRTRDGQIRWITDRSVELFGHNGLSYGSVGILLDITERKQVEDELRKRESILQSVTFCAEQFLKTPDWRKNIDIVLERLGHELDASHAYLFENFPGPNGEQFNSLKYEWDAPGRTSDLNNPEFQNVPVYKGGFERYHQIMDSGEPFIGSTSFYTDAESEKLRPLGLNALLEMQVRVNGEWWGTIGFDDVHEREWNAMEVAVVKVVANMLSAAIKRQMDREELKNELAERKRAEEALIFSEEKFSKAFHTTPVMMTIDNADGIFIEVNKAFMDNTGFTRNDIIGHGASELNMWVYDEERELVQKLLREQGSFKDIEISYQRKSGNKAVVLMSSEKFHVNDAVYTLTSALDITERKLVEAEREKLIDELEAKNEELERFTYTVSHDLKSPLVTINGFLGYLEHDAVTGNMERMRKDILRIQESVDKMQRLLNELLELSRIGRMINAPDAFAFQELVSEASEIVYGRLQAREITVEVSPEAGRQIVYGDKPRLIEAMQNMLENAAKYMGDQPNPHIEVGQAGDEDEMPIYYVKDNGIGIAPEYHERIFGLFNKLDPTTEGTGVGLSLVKRIIEIHGGRIWVKSEEGQGATFYFSLPKPPEG